MVSQAVLIVMSLLWAVDNSDAEVSKRVPLTDVLNESRQASQFVSLCGPLSLAHILSQNGESLDFRDFLLEFDRSTDGGVKIQAILGVAKRYGYRADALLVSNKNLETLELPTILLVNDGAHCVVLSSYDSQSQSVTIWDPSILRPVRMPTKTFLQMWNGEVIHISRTRLDVIDLLDVVCKVGVVIIGGVVLKAVWTRWRSPKAK
jgi:predicted double-glycine peptidase